MKMNNKQRMNTGMLQTMNYSQRLVVYGMLGGIVLTLVSFLVTNMALSNDLFYMGYFVVSVDATAGPSVMALHGFPFSFMSTSAVATMFGYFAFLANFIVYVLVVVAIGLLYQRYK